MVSSAPQAKPVFNAGNVPSGQADQADQAQADQARADQPQVSQQPPYQPQHQVNEQAPLPNQPQQTTGQISQEEYEQYLYEQQQRQQQLEYDQQLAGANQQEQQYNIPDQQGWWQGPLQPQAEYLIAEWQAASRVTTARSKQYYSSLAVIVLLASLILFFAGQTLLIFVLLAFLFISYVLSSISAEQVIHQITTYGIRYRSERLYYWEQLGRFWVRNNRGHLEIHIEAPAHFGNELILLPSTPGDENPVTAQDLVDIFSRYLLYEEPIPSQMDRWVMWLQDKFPLE